jgi:integrase
MATLRLRYIHEFPDRHGTVRRYFRRNGKRTPLPGEVGSVEFMAAYQAALGESVAEPPKKVTQGGKTMAALVELHYRTSGWKSLAPSTQRVSKNIAQRIVEACGDRPAITMPRAAIRAIIDSMADRPGAANSFLRMFRALMQTAIAYDWRQDDPTAGVKPVRYRKASFATWTEEHIKQFRERHPDDTMQGRALALLLFTAQRRSDVVALGPKHHWNHRLHLVQRKTGTSLSIPIHRELAPILDATPAGQETYLVTSYGQPFTAPGFGNWFRKACNDAELPELSAHGLRRAASRRLAEAGATPHMIKAITGHKRLAEVDLYTEQANQEDLADEAMDLLQRTGARTPGGKPSE